jgi:hypothetical protein
LIKKKEVYISLIPRQSARTGTNLYGFDRHCPQITSLAEIFCAEHSQIMGPLGIVVSDHSGNVNLILQNCGDVDIKLPRST